MTRTPRQAEAARRNGRLGRGPSTPKGRARAALKSLRHGLDARHVPLGGEEWSVYEAHIDGRFSALGPENDAQARGRRARRGCRLAVAPPPARHGWRRPRSRRGIVERSDTFDEHGAARDALIPLDGMPQRPVSGHSGEQGGHDLRRHT